MDVCRLYLTSFFLSFLLSGNCQQIGNTTKDTISAYRGETNKAILLHDIVSLASYWLPDFTVIKGNGTVLHGRKKVLRSWRKIFAKQPSIFFKRNLKEVVISDTNEMAWELGIWEASNTYSKGGNYSAMWRRINGTWKLQAELFVAVK
jgi:ketosteroid isomerase-like protein